MASASTPFILVDADGPHGSQINSNDPVRRIYYTTSPSFRLAERLVIQDRKGRAAASPKTIKLASQRLTGTPLDWQRLGLQFDQNPMPVRPLGLTSKLFSEAIQGGVDLQIVDLRPMSPGNETSPFPHALRLLPHQLENDPAKLSKQRWIVLIDGGDRVAQPIAERMFQQGYLLTTVLEGGFPAWINATDR